MQKQQQVKDPLKTIQDVVTRWSSTYKMISRLVVLKPYLQIMFLLNLLPAEKKLSEHQWAIIETLTIILQPFANIQTFLEGSSYITSSWVPYVVAEMRNSLNHLITTLTQPSNDHDNQQREIYATLLPLVEDMLSKFTERFGDGNSGIKQTRGSRNIQVGISKAYYLSAILDPRTKKLSYLTDECKKEVEELLEKEIIEYLNQKQIKSAKRLNNDSAKMNDSVSKASTKSESTNLNTFASLDKYFPDDTDALNDMISGNDANASLNNIVSIQEQARQAIASWMAAKPLGRNEDVMKYWKHFETVFPSIAPIAKKYLCCMATSAECERAASTAGDVVTKERSRLDADNVKNLVFLHDSHKKIMNLKIQVDLKDLNIVEG